METIDSLRGSDGGFDKSSIMKIIPYNDYFLMIDKVTFLDKTKIIATKTISMDEDYLKGHFVGFPIMPGALIIEGMGQTGTLLVRYNLENHQSKDILAYKIKDTKFASPAFPGDTLTYEISLVGKDDRGALLTGKAMVNDRRVSETTLMLAIVNSADFRKRYQ